MVSHRGVVDITPYDLNILSRNSIIRVYKVLDSLAMLVHSGYTVIIAGIATVLTAKGMQFALTVATLRMAALRASLAGVFGV